LVLRSYYRDKKVVGVFVRFHYAASLEPRTYSREQTVHGSQSKLRHAKKRDRFCHGALRRLLVPIFAANNTTVLSGRSKTI
jgi:hypothetical protein